MGLIIISLREMFKKYKNHKFILKYEEQLAKEREK